MWPQEKNSQRDDCSFNTDVSKKMLILPMEQTLSLSVSFFSHLIFKFYFFARSREKKFRFGKKQTLKVTELALVFEDD